MRQADIPHEREWESTNESHTIADEGQVPENDQANQPKTTPTTKTPPKKPNQKTTTKQTKTTEPALHPGET